MKKEKAGLCQEHGANKDKYMYHSFVISSPLLIGGVRIMFIT